MFGKLLKKMCACAFACNRGSADEDKEEEEEDRHGSLCDPDESLDEIAEELREKLKQLAEEIRQHPDNLVHGAVFSIPGDLRAATRMQGSAQMAKMIDTIQQIFDRELGSPDEREVLSMDVEIVNNEDIPYALKKYENRLLREMEAAKTLKSIVGGYEGDSDDDGEETDEYYYDTSESESEIDRDLEELARELMALKFDQKYCSI